MSYDAAVKGFLKKAMRCLTASRGWNSSIFLRMIRQKLRTRDVEASPGYVENSHRRALLLEITPLILGGLAAETAAAYAADNARPADPIRGLPAGAASHFAQINGIRLHYVAMGSGPLLMLLHGWPETWYAWRDVIPRLAKRYRVIAPDLRGIGLSERPSTGYDKRTIAEDLRALITHEGERQAYVVGHDMGGKAAYVLAHIHPEIVAKLVLVDCLVPGTENLDALRGGAWHYGFHITANVPEMLTRGREKDYIAAQIRAWSYRQDAIDESVVAEYASRYATPGGMTAGFNYYRALQEDIVFVSTIADRRLRMPVMSIAGQYGVGGKLAAALSLETNALVSVIAAGCGHFVAEEDHEFFCAQIESFLAG